MTFTEFLLINLVIVLGLFSLGCVAGSLFTFEAIVQHRTTLKALILKWILLIFFIFAGFNSCVMNSVITQSSDQTSTLTNEK